MKTNVLIGMLLLCLTIFGGVAVLQRLRIDRQPTKTVAIIQTTSHPALDAVRDGCVQELKKLSPSCQIVTQNGQGSIDQLHMMAKNLAQGHIDAIVAIATPAAQAIAHVEHKKPIIIAAVTDPHAAGIVQPNVCGCLDTIDCAQQLKLIKALVPTVKTMGILFNIGEVNAVTLSNHMKQLCAQERFTCIELGVAYETDIPLLLDQRLQECDIVWAPLDNTVASTITVIVHKTLQAKKPFFVSDNLLVHKGALAAVGVNYTNIGEQAAHSVSAALFEGKQPAAISFSKPTTEKYCLNRNVMEQLGLAVPVSLNVQDIEWAELSLPA